MATGEIVIKMESDMTEYVYECLEDDIRNLLEKKGINAEIFDQTVNGQLILGEKIWFNDEMRCRLRICGFTQDQIKKIRTSRFVDLTLTDFIDDDMPGVAIYIREWGGNENRENSCE